MKAHRQQLRKADVVVLALGAALLISSVGAVGPQGRGRAREMVCLANLSQWHAVFQDYRQQNDGTFFTGTNSTGYWWLAQLDETTQSWKKNRTWFCPTAATPLVDEFGVSTPGSMTLKAWGIFSGDGLLGPDGIAGSYGLNGYTIAVPDWASYEGGIRGSDGWRNFDSIAHTGNVPWFVDALRFDLWPLYTDGPAANEFAAWSSNHMARCCVNRHHGAVNCLFADGSARKVGLKELWTLKWHRSFDTAGPWTKAGGVLPSDWPAWMRDFQDY